MAELGIASGVCGVVGFGAKLSAALYGFASTVISARREISSVAEEVVQSCAVLGQISKAISKPNAARYSTSTLGTLLDITASCHGSYTELDQIITKLQTEQPKSGDITVSFVAKVKWAFRQRSKVQDIRDGLNTTKLTLLLMLSTLNLSEELLSRR
jgi:hypothetical protein